MYIKSRSLSADCDEQPGAAFADFAAPPNQVLANIGLALAMVIV